MRLFSENSLSYTFAKILHYRENKKIFEQITKNFTLNLNIQIFKTFFIVDENYNMNLAIPSAPFVEIRFFVG